MKTPLTVDDYFTGVVSGDRNILGKAITLTESSLESDRLLAAELIRLVLPRCGNSFRIGVTGVPGAGKSTFIQSLGQGMLENGENLAVLAIDPSSDISGGSILADKTRMESLLRHSEVFVRPTPARNKLGGVAISTPEAIWLCEAAGYKNVIVETVGVGQSEIMIRQITDFTILLLIAGAGDELQAIKKGVMEIADLLVINKADGENTGPASKALSELQNTITLLPTLRKGYRTQAVTCSSLTGDGIPQILSLTRSYRDMALQTGALAENRRSQNRQHLLARIDSLLTEYFHNDTQVLKRLQELENHLDDGLVSPALAADELVKLFRSGFKPDTL